MQNLPIDDKLSQAYLDVTRRGILFLVVCDFCIAVFTAVLLGIIFASTILALAAFLLFVIASALACTNLVLNTIKQSQWLLTEPLVCLMDRLDSESKAMQSHGIVQQNNARGHAKITVQNAPSFNQTQEIVRLVPIRTSNKLVDDIDETDLAAFIDRMFIVGHSVRALMGTQLPSGKKIDTFETLSQHMNPLLKTGIIKDRSERKKGYLTVETPEQAKQLLGLSSGEVKQF